jgi:Uma2 family endonuclease
MPSLKRQWTVDDLEDLPDDGNRYEIIDGELLVTSAPSLDHQEAVLQFAELLRGYLQHERVGHLVV